MVTVQVAAHHEVDVLDPEPGCLERVHPVGIVLLVPRRAQREVLIVADAGIDQNVVMRRLDDIGLVAQYDIDVERCECGGKLKLIAVIEEAAVIEKILKHIGLDPQPPPRAKARRGELFGAD